MEIIIMVIIIIIIIIVVVVVVCNSARAGMAQSVQRLATGWAVRDRIPLRQCLPHS
jgi:hypothetical protein